MSRETGWVRVCMRALNIKINTFKSPFCLNYVDCPNITTLVDWAKLPCSFLPSLELRSKWVAVYVCGYPGRFERICNKQ